jgi:inosine/xanthosine triphosphatase
MDTLKIAFGGTSEQKIGYLKEVLDELKIVAEIEPIKVESGISEQPMSSDETKNGSLNRAINALEKSKNSNFAIGIEVGYEKNEEGDYEMFCWTSIISKDARISTRSHSFLLPKFHQDILNKGLYLGDYVREYINNNTDPINLQIGEDIRGRKPFITNAVRNCLLLFFREEKLIND